MLTPLDAQESPPELTDNHKKAHAMRTAPVARVDGSATEVLRKTIQD